MQVGSCQASTYHSHSTFRRVFGCEVVGLGVLIRTQAVCMCDIDTCERMGGCILCRSSDTSVGCLPTKGVCSLWPPWSLRCKGRSHVIQPGLQH